MFSKAYNNFTPNLKLNNFINRTPSIKYSGNSILSQINNIENNVAIKQNNNISTSSNNNMPISLNNFEPSNMQGQQNKIINNSNYKLVYENRIIKLNLKPQSSSNLMVRGLLNTPSRNTSTLFNNYYHNGMIYKTNNFNNSYKLENNIYSTNNFNQLNPIQLTNLTKSINNNINKQPFINTEKISYYPNNNVNGKKSFDYTMNKRYIILNYNNIRGPQSICSPFIYK